jgi:hypothetical protein
MFNDSDWPKYTLASNTNPEVVVYTTQNGLKVSLEIVSKYIVKEGVLYVEVKLPKSGELL